MTHSGPHVLTHLTGCEETLMLADVYPPPDIGDVSLHRPTHKEYAKMNAISCGSARAPLLGHNLVRLLYLDEGGSDHKAPILSVAGILVHGDQEWPEVDRRIGVLIEKYIPESDRFGFVFHATDIYHGSRYFDRRKPQWNSEEKRIPILIDLAEIINDLHLPVVTGNYRKEKFGAGLQEEWPTMSAELKGKFIHNAAAADCLLRADRWLERFAPSELATVVHEDGASAKQMIKRTVRFLRSTERLEAGGVDFKFRQQFNLPLKRIIDTVHFAEKSDARPLQLADLCAFTYARGLKEQPVPEQVTKIIWRHTKWIFEPAAPSSEPPQ